MSAELIARLEAAPRPQFVLDQAIHEAVSSGAPMPPPAYTVSIDRALGLVAKGWSYTIESDAAWVRWIEDGDVREVHHIFFGRGGGSTALALCIAALKAWAARPETAEPKDAA